MIIVFTKVALLTPYIKIKLDKLGKIIATIFWKFSLYFLLVCTIF